MPLRVEPRPVSRHGRSGVARYAESALGAWMVLAGGGLFLYYSDPTASALGALMASLGVLVVLVDRRYVRP